MAERRVAGQSPCSILEEVSKEVSKILNDKVKVMKEVQREGNRVAFIKLSKLKSLRVSRSVGEG